MSWTYDLVGGPMNGQRLTIEKPPLEIQHWDEIAGCTFTAGHYRPAKTLGGRGKLEWCPRAPQEPA